MMRIRDVIRIVPLIVILVACRDLRLNTLTGTKIATPAPVASETPADGSSDPDRPDTVVGGIVTYPSGRPDASIGPTASPRASASPGPTATPEPVIDCAMFDPTRTVNLYACYPAAGVEVTFGTVIPWNHQSTLVLRLPVASGSVPLGPSEAKVHARVLFANGTRLVSEDENPMTRLVTWSSSQADLVTVDVTGKVQVVGQATGSVIITGRTLDGAQNASVQVTVDDSGDLDLVIE